MEHPRDQTVMAVIHNDLPRHGTCAFVPEGPGERQQRAPLDDAVGIERDDDVAACLLESQSEGLALAPVRRLPQGGDQLRLPGCYALDMAPGIVCAAVIHHDDL